MRILIWVGRILLLLFLIRMVLQLIFGAARRRQVGRPPRGPMERAGGALVQDPQCGTYLPKDRAIPVIGGASVMYFCSATCRDAYAAAHASAR